MCLVARPLFVGGVGERMGARPALPEAAVVLANPGRPLPTPAVFRRLALRPSRPARFAASPTTAARLAASLGRRRNDLTEAAAGLEPAIPAVLATLAAAGALLARMSGSGATCFGLFPDTASASVAASDIIRREPGWWVRAGRLRNCEPAIERVAGLQQ
jgi:4-diphosphocytidyl-2-C-methyl-D-erythritol kinase